MGFTNNLVLISILLSAGSTGFSKPTEPKKFYVEREYAEAAQRYNVDARLLKAVLFTESNLNHEAINPLTLDYGIGQINYKTADQYGIDTRRLVTDRAYSIDRAAYLLSTFKHLKLKPESNSWVCHYNVGGSPIKTEARLKACEKYLNKIKYAYEILDFN